MKLSNRKSEEIYHELFMANFSDKSQLKAVKERPHLIRYIENPCEKAQIKAIEIIPSSYRFIKNPTKKVKLLYHLMTKI